MSAGNWVRACATGDIDEEDLISWEHGGRSFAIYNTGKGYFATDGMCTHEDQGLAEGFVIGTVIECPLHQGKFDIPSGKALSAPVCVDLKTYPVKIDGDDIFVDVS